MMVHKFLQDAQKGKVKIPVGLYFKFERECRASLQKQLERENRPFKLYMSNVGKPICQLQFEQLGIPGEYVATDIIRNVYGNLTETTLMFLLYASGVPIIEEQKDVSLDIGGITLRGRLDFVSDFGVKQVWDVKSASDWAFKNKFNKSFEEIIREDNYGYGEQLFLYAEAYGCKAGGLVIFNKSSSEIRVIEAPKEQRSIRKRILDDVEAKIRKILSNEQLADSKSQVSKGDLLHNSNSSKQSDKLSIDRQFEPVEEVFNRKKTGNMLLPQPCTFCQYRFKCWENLQLKPKAMSTAKNKEMVYYSKYEHQIS